jgi:hypothetical protein
LINQADINSAGVLHLASELSHTAAAMVLEAAEEAIEKFRKSKRDDGQV